jgi:hypothetical protein
MPAAKKPAKAKRTTATARKAAAEPAAVKRLNKSLDSAQESLAALRKDVSKDVSVGARKLYGEPAEVRQGRAPGRAQARAGASARRRAGPQGQLTEIGEGRHRSPQAGGEEEGRGTEEVAQ